MKEKTFRLGNKYVYIFDHINNILVVLAYCYDNFKYEIKMVLYDDFIKLGFKECDDNFINRLFIEDGTIKLMKPELN